MIDAVVYSLSDPITKEIKYIGKTSTGRNIDDINIAISKRIKDHQRDKCNPDKSFWISELKRLGLSPLFTILVHCHSDIAVYIERKEIYNHIANGCKLFNMKIIAPLTKSTPELDSISNGFDYCVANGLSTKIVKPIIEK